MMSGPLSVLALNPFHGGSHRAFLEQWIAHSQHSFSVLSRPGTNWKWRMREAPVSLAVAVSERPPDETWDVLFTTDMLNLAEFRGLCPRVGSLPAIVYFHENQLTYPQSQRADEASRTRDLHYAFSNFVTAAAADEVWFNSQFHQTEFLSALRDWLKRMPDGNFSGSITKIERQSRVVYPGIESREFVSARTTEPDDDLRIAWVSRWEHDKAPDIFFDALRILREQGVAFRLNMLGESYSKIPDCMAAARAEFADEIDHWGYLPDRQVYISTLQNCDVVVSTARHEFFGIAILEAIAEGCIACVPDALAYPEVLNADVAVFHNNTPADVASKLATLVRQQADRKTQYDFIQRYSWQRRCLDMDDRLVDICREAKSS